MDEARQIAMEEWVIDFLDARRKEKNLTVEEWAKLVFPEAPRFGCANEITGTTEAARINWKTEATNIFRIYPYGAGFGYSSE